jgi:hypothetical protein
LRDWQLPFGSFHTLRLRMMTSELGET